MEKQDWSFLDKVIITSLIAVVEGVVVGQIVGLDGACTSLLIPCWLYALVVWVSVVIITYFGLIKGGWSIVKRWEQRNNDLREQEKLNIDKSKIMTLTADALRSNNNRLDLRIHNNESSYIVLQKVFVAHRDNVPAVEQSPRSRLSAHPDVRVEHGTTQTTSFLTEVQKPPSFVIRGYLDNGTTHDVIYSLGVHRFDVTIVYDSKENKIYGKIKRFNVTVNYKAPKEFEVDIKDDD